jgi:phage tail sheath protein FI
MIYGQKTCLRQSKAMNRINVVRNVNVISRNVERIARGYVFSLNDASTWNDLTRALRSYLSNIAERGGLTNYGVTIQPTNEQIDQLIIYGKIFIQPVRVAEKIYLDISIDSTGATVTVQ